jgi:hypothetical protein
MNARSGPAVALELLAIFLVPVTAGSGRAAPQQSSVAPAVHARLHTLPQAAASNPQPASPNMSTSENTQLLTVRERNFQLLTRSRKLQGTGDETVEFWELRDASDRVIHQETYPVSLQDGGFESTVSIGAESFTTDQGGGILVHGMDLPSAPGGGGWVRVFGYRYGREKYAADPSLFGAFGPPVAGEFLELGTDPSRPSPQPSGGPTVTVMHDVLKFRVWTGNFSIVYPVLINWITGKLQPAWRCLEMTSQGQVERCSYPITVEVHREDQPTFVRLFPQPDGGYVPKHVIVQPQSRVQYVEARVPVAWNEEANGISFDLHGDTWMKIRIDGVEGWIHNEEDFQAVGLAQAG